MKRLLWVSLAISLINVRSFSTINHRTIRRLNLYKNTRSIQTSMINNKLSTNKFRNNQILSMSTSGIENPMNPNLYTEKAWDAIAKAPQYCDKYSTQYVEAPLLLKVSYSLYLNLIFYFYF